MLVVWIVLNPSPLTAYTFTATLSWLMSHAIASPASELEMRRRFETAVGGRVSGGADVAPVGGGVQTGIFAAVGFAVVMAAAAREIAGAAT